MALVLVQRTAHRTLGLAAIDQLTMEIPCSIYRVINRDSVATLYVRFDGIDPVVAGPDTFLVAPNTSKEFTPNPPSTEVRIISSNPAATLPYSVECVV